MDLSRIPEPLRSKLKDQLDNLPPEVRGKLEAQLARVPAEQLEAVLAKTSPLFERLAKKGGTGKASAGGRSAVARPGTIDTLRQARNKDPDNHFNATIGRGDRPMPNLLLIAFVVALGLVLLRGCGAPA